MTKIERIIKDCMDTVDLFYSKKLIDTSSESKLFYEYHPHNNPNIDNHSLPKMYEYVKKKISYNITELDLSQFITRMSKMNGQDYTHRRKCDWPKLKLYGLYSSCLLNLIIEQKKKTKKSKRIHIKGEEINEGEGNYPYLFCKVNGISDMILENVSSDRLLSQANYNEKVDSLILNNCKGAFMLTNFAQRGKVDTILINNCKGYQIGSNFASYGEINNFIVNKSQYTNESSLVTKGSKLEWLLINEQKDGVSIVIDNAQKIFILNSDDGNIGNNTAFDSHPYARYSSNPKVDLLYIYNCKGKNIGNNCGSGGGNIDTIVIAKCKGERIAHEVGASVNKKVMTCRADWHCGLYQDVYEDKLFEGHVKNLIVSDCEETPLKNTYYHDIGKDNKNVDNYISGGAGYNKHMELMQQLEIRKLLEILNKQLPAVDLKKELLKYRSTVKF